MRLAPSFRRPSLRRAAAPLAAALALVVLATPAAAQQSYSRVGAKLKLVGSDGPCVDTPLSGGTSVSGTCIAYTEQPGWCVYQTRTDPRPCHMYDTNVWKDIGLDSVYAMAKASTNDGQLRVKADLVVETRERTTTTAGYAQGYAAYAAAEWRDNLDLTQYTRSGGMWVELTAWFHGGMAVNSGSIRTPGVLDYDTRAVTRFSFDHTPDDRHDGASWTEVEELLTNGSTFAERHKTYSVGEAHAFRTFIPPNQQYVPFSYFLSTEVSAPRGHAYSAREDIIASHAYSNFGSTAGLSGVRFFAADGATELTDVAYSFVNGTKLVAATTTPEPATLALVGADPRRAGAPQARRRSAARRAAARRRTPAR
jgi:hypothetical protein